MSELRRGRVLRGDARVYHVDVDGEVIQAAPRGRLFDELPHDVKTPVAVGDWVRLSPDGDPPGIESVEERRNTLSRQASAHDRREQILFANVDQLFVVGSLKSPGFSSNRTDRILAACNYHEIPAHLILNKLDLDESDELADIAPTYRNAGVDVLPTCAVDGRGMQELEERLQGKVSVFYGASGAGKSTLLNAIDPTLKLKTGKISRFWEQGRHTTTFSRMHRLERLDAWVIDTPGIRVFRLIGINAAELRGLFPELEALQSQCRFPDCSHDHEPECAVFDAVERGELAPTRLASYLEMRDELVPYSDDGVVAPPEE